MGRSPQFPTAEGRHASISTRQLAERCSALLDIIPVRCKDGDFNEELSEIYDPQGKIIVVRDKIAVEEENWAEAQRQEGTDENDDDLYYSQGQPAPGWMEKFGGVANRVGHALGGKKQVGIPGPIGHLQGVWAP